MWESLTFLLALLGYAGLTGLVLVSGRGGASTGACRVVAVIAGLHVLLVWHFRYAWSWSLATRNGYAGPVIFHTALALLIAAPLLRPSHRVQCVRLAFFVVTLGAVGAVFRYDDVAAYRGPVLACAALGGVQLGSALWSRVRELTAR